MINSGSLQWLNNVAIVIEKAHKDFHSLLTAHLKAYHIQIAADPTHAKYLLIIDNETIQRNISGISSGTTARQNQLIYTISFKLQGFAGNELIPSTNIVVLRQITLNSNRILGSKDEEALEIDEMRRDAAIQLLNQLSRFSLDSKHSKHQQPAEPR
jgi:LPS-assembly lipoprotein